jgi:hypothetical protein
MHCSFCDNPAAHPATGCQYSPNVLACYYCVMSFWSWIKGHIATRSRPGRNKKEHRKGRLEADFYAAVGVNHPTGRNLGSGR